jgi:hypothetical protein
MANINTALVQQIFHISKRKWLISGMVLKYRNGDNFVIR